MKYLGISLLSATLLFSISLGGPSCTFPRLWHGEYFHLEFPAPLVVTNNSITEKGVCVWNLGSQYVLKGEDNGESCWRCLSIHRKHQNVLQYKESDCEYKNQFRSYEDLCHLIPADDPMLSMFRRNAPPTRCPMVGPHMFSYARGGTGTACREPMSYFDTCERNEKMKLHYQACTDVKGSQSKTEEWKCIASWRDGARSYFVGELLDNYMISEKSRFRCFVYEKDAAGRLQIAESGAATCKGLWSPHEGYRVFTMEPVRGEACRYPGWLARHHTWHSLAPGQHFHINSGERSIKITTQDPDSMIDVDEYLSCHTIFSDHPPSSKSQSSRYEANNINSQTVYVNSPSDRSTKSHPDLITLESNIGRNNGRKLNKSNRRSNDIKIAGQKSNEDVKIVHYVRSGASCDSGYVCTVVTRLTDNLVAIRTGAKARDPKDSCKAFYFGRPAVKIYIARSSGHHATQQQHHGLACPLNGRYLVMPSPFVAAQTDVSKATLLGDTCGAGASVGMSSGCGSKLLEFSCDAKDSLLSSNDNKNKTQLKFHCHAHWTGLQGGGATGVSNLVLSRPDQIGYYCMSYTDNGLSLAMGECVSVKEGGYRYSQTGPCIQALSATRSAASGPRNWTKNLFSIIYISTLTSLLLQ
eukprot:TRINITY_DN12927_c0_g1_i6.p1 TRINITY_DN12927_c0_g1~~TRINITY_DN12927_c0_g1_i6.p1  ORF type:complete len:638 (+),score=83.57 TRINITY_DN12927_c0_g1_i6:105-2018(+)